jgi:hypothetical protein
VIDEPLDVSQIRYGRGDGSVQRRRTVRRDGQIPRLREGGALKPTGVTAAAGYVQLQTVDGGQQRSHVVHVSGVFPGRDRISLHDSGLIRERLLA